MHWTGGDRGADRQRAVAALALIGGLVAVIAVQIGGLETVLDGGSRGAFNGIDQSTADGLRGVGVALAFLSALLGVLIVSLGEGRARRARVGSWLLTLSGIAMTGFAIAAVSAATGQREIPISTPPGVAPIVHVSAGFGSYLLVLAGAIVTIASLFAIPGRQHEGVGLG